MTLPSPVADKKKTAGSTARGGENRMLTGPEKVAALMLAMGKKTATRILSHFEADEIKVLAQTATDLGSISKEVVDDIIAEFGQSSRPAPA